MNYYRLKQTDLDGAFSYSGIESVSFNEKETLVLYPNPVNDILTVSGLLDDENISVINLNGQKQEVAVNQKNGVVTIHVNDLTNGIYILQIKGIKETRFQRFLKQ